jgi:hypothetical protein
VSFSPRRSPLGTPDDPDALSTYNPVVTRMSTATRLLERHRRLTAVLGVVVVLGVAALNVHAALPEHHHDHGGATVCVAALSIAVLAAAAGLLLRARARLARLPRLDDARRYDGVVRRAPRATSRAGPLRQTVPLVLRT